MYRIARTFGWTPAEQDEQPAVLLDWLLQIHDSVTRAEEEKANG